MRVATCIQAQCLHTMFFFLHINGNGVGARVGNRNPSNFDACINLCIGRVVAKLCRRPLLSLGLSALRMQLMLERGQGLLCPNHSLLF